MNNYVDVGRARARRGVGNHTAASRHPSQEGNLVRRARRGDNPATPVHPRISEAPSHVIAKPPPHLRYVPMICGEAIQG
ncbi:MAG: hypothetical protein LBM98_09565 [Oscillospiraceae bacterium]|nr:hypothetical protein [Oscillospiraceae bacterium]